MSDFAFKPDPKVAAPRKKYRRVVASPKRWAQIIAAKTGPCRCCGALAPISHHHVVPRGGVWGGSDCEANIVPVCGSGSSLCHGLIENHDRPAMRALVLSLTDEEYAYAVDKGGENFFERHYGVRYTKGGTA